MITTNQLQILAKNITKTNNLYPISPLSLESSMPLSNYSTLIAIETTSMPHINHSIHTLVRP